MNEIKPIRIEPDYEAALANAERLWVRARVRRREIGLMCWRC